ncbi:hypothetical protein FORC41_2580 [Escherichia coli]|nr:hypothetical protein FORC41_2580 [Escherichia coli]
MIKKAASYRNGLAVVIPMEKYKGTILSCSVFLNENSSYCQQ